METTFVALVGDENALAALRIIEQVEVFPCATRVLGVGEGEDELGEHDVIVVTYNSSSESEHWPGKWLRVKNEGVTGERPNEMLPEWAKEARRAVIIKPIEDIEKSWGFRVSVLQVAAMMLGVKYQASWNSLVLHPHDFRSPHEPYYRPE